MSERVRGSVINVHALGAAVRLEDGRLVSVPLMDVNKNRASYTRALGTKTTLPFDLEGRAAVVVRRGDEVVAVVRLDDRDGRIIHVHTVARPSLAR